MLLLLVNYIKTVLLFPMTNKKLDLNGKNLKWLNLLP